MSSVPYVFLQLRHLGVFQPNPGYFLVKTEPAPTCAFLLGGNSFRIFQPSSTQYLDPGWVFPGVFSSPQNLACKIQHGKMETSGLTEFIPFICTSAACFFASPPPPSSHGGEAAACEVWGALIHIQRLEIADGYDISWLLIRKEVFSSHRIKFQTALRRK